MRNATFKKPETLGLALNEEMIRKNIHDMIKYLVRNF